MRSTPLSLAWMVLAISTLAPYGLKTASADPGVEIRNFHKVVGEEGGPRLYRSGQPTYEGLKSLLRTKHLAANQVTVISLHDKEKDIRREQEDCNHLGINFQSRPVNHRAVQNKDYINGILNLVDYEMSQGHTVLIHCWAGQDRTGLLIGLYRTQRQIGKWSPFAAWNEMIKYGFHTQFTTLWGHFNHENGLNWWEMLSTSDNCSKILSRH